MYVRMRPYPSENRKLAEKRCKKCGEVLPISEFGWNGRGDWNARCKRCVLAKNRRHASKRRSFLNDIKSGYGCQCGCGETEPSALLFHHRDPSQKVDAVGRMLMYSMKRLLTEIAKCDVMCFNCHAKAHAGIIPFPSRTKDIEPVSK